MLDDPPPGLPPPPAALPVARRAAGFPDCKFRPHRVKTPDNVKGEEWEVRL